MAEWTFEQAAKAIIDESIRRGHARDETIAELSTAIQESGLRMVWSKNRKWFGYYQQDGGYKDRMDPMGNIRGFFDRLEPKRRGKPGASGDPFANIFWLQQGPNWPSAEHGLRVGRRAYYDEIRRHIDRATKLYDQFAGQGGEGTDGCTQTDMV